MSVTNSSCSSRSLSIGIIGFGNFAQFLAKTMIRQGHCIRATSRTDYSEICLKMGISFFSDAQVFLEAKNDVILICTSILSMSDVLRSMPLHFLKMPTLFVDVLSVKEHPKKLLLQVLPEESDILCTHPMFGPQSGKNGWIGLTCVYEKVRIKNEPPCSSFLQIFEREKENTMKDSFDLYSGLFLHNKFAQQELEDLEQAIKKVKQKLLAQR